MKKVLLLFAGLLLFCGAAMSQRTVMGTVTDINGEPLIGANVVIKGTTTGTTTDFDGKYSLSGVPQDGAVLVISYTGFSTQELAVGASNVIDVSLAEDAALLGEVVVVGYGTQSRRNLTSSIASVDSRAFENVSVQGFEQALQGRMPGVVINGNAGTLGAQQSIRVRGVGSINANNQPLFVVDGMILNSDVDGALVLGGPGTNPLMGLNPNDIESIDVLKDAASAAIYGSRGSNGVVVITTKSGKYNQKPSVSLNYYAGTSSPTRQYDLMTGPEYARVWNYGSEVRGFNRTDHPGQFYDVDAQPTANWLDLVSQNGFVQETSASVSGGTQSTKYYLGATYRDEDGWIKTTNLKRYSFRLNLEQQINDKLTAGLQLNPSRTINTRQNEDNNVSSPQTFSVLFFPNVDPFDENGNTRGGIVRTDLGFASFAGTPLANLEGQDITLGINQVLANAYAEYRILPNLKLRSELGSQLGQYEDLYKAASYTTDGFGAGGVGQASLQSVYNWSWQTTANYANEVGRSRYDVTLGYTMNREQVTTFNVAGNTFASDALKTLNSAAEITSGGGTATDVTFLGYLGRLNYSFDDKYLLSASMRIDGSSRFGVNNRFGYFPAVSAGWIISEEDFFGNNTNIDFLKLRGSWGISGNAGIGNFDSRGLVGFGNDYNMLPGFMFTRLENADLEWEKNTTVDVALEFGILNNRISGSLGYYNRLTTDLLLDVPIPQTTGIVNAVITQNAGEMVNRGFEFMLDFNILNGPFQWNLGFNGATVDNEVLKLVDNNMDGEDDDIFIGQSLIRTGESVGSWYLVEYAGVNPENGDARFRNLDGEESSAYSLDDRIVAGTYIPKISGGITSNMAFMGFDFSMLWQFASGHQLYRNEGRFLETQLASVFNQDRSQLDHWRPDNTDTDVPEARRASNGNQHSTRYLSDADFIRLKNVQLGYTFKNLGMNNTNVRLFVAGQNLLTFTDFDGLDPEASGQDASGVVAGNLFFSRPQSKQVTFGVNVNF
jgi:TonB-dependent starch-binding outer membrane protein SusC